MKRIILNDGAQKDFVNNHERYSAYIGGVGSGKTFAGIARGLKFSQQPKKGFHGPRGLIGAESLPVLRDVVLPQFFEMMDGSGLWRTDDPEKDYLRTEKKALLKNNAEILFRSLDDPEARRGTELSWFHIDEGRNVEKAAMDVLMKRLRQQGYAHAGWVTSTPNGYDWMYNYFHPDSPEQLARSKWFGAPTYDNAAHLDEDYLADLEANTHGLYYQQEVQGKFVGVVSGAVFPHWDSAKFVTDVAWVPALPLYSFWDFGIGDPGTCVFGQIRWEEIVTPKGVKARVPHLALVGFIEAEGWAAEEWATAYKEYCVSNFQGEMPMKNIGDPAGKQRNAVTGTSVIEAIAACGVHIIPAPKKPQDYATSLLDNMMAGGRVEVSREFPRVAAALATHKWPRDKSGNKTGNKPVHDWTSHFCDAIRYGVTVLLTHFPRKNQEAPPGGFSRGTVGHILEQLDMKPEEWLGPQSAPSVDWGPQEAVEV